MRERAPAWEAELAAMHRRIAARFVHPEAHRRALAYLKGLLGPAERKNGWQLAEYAGDARPDGVQRLLSTYRWDVDGVREDIRDYVVEHLGDEQAVLVVDEMGFLKQGRQSVGVERQYNRTAGRRENCQVGVFLAYASRRGCAILDRELYLSEDWHDDRDRKEKAGVPDELPSLRKDELAGDMIDRALKAGVPGVWVVADAVCCNDSSLRRRLEVQGVAHVMAVDSEEGLLTRGEEDRAWVWVTARRLAEQIPHLEWRRFACGAGDQVLRYDDWARVSLGHFEILNKWHWLLVRRSVADPNDVGYYVCFARTDASLAELARVAGHGSIVADTFKAARREVGLDTYEVRRWTGWYRHITLAMLAHAVLTVTRHHDVSGDAKGEGHAIRSDR